MAFGAKAAELEAQGHHVIKFNIGEPDFGAPPDVLLAMQKLATTAPLPYTSALGLPELRAAIAGFYKTAHNVDINPNRVVVTAGASAALLLLSAQREQQSLQMNWRQCANLPKAVARGVSLMRFTLICIMARRMQSLSPRCHLMMKPSL